MANFFIGPQAEATWPQPGTGLIKILQCKFYATQFFQHFDWMIIISANTRYASPPWLLLLMGHEILFWKAFDVLNN